MRKLTDVYIKVTKQNQDELQNLLNRKLKINEEILFSSDCKKSQYIGLPFNNEKKVSLNELKRLIDTIPTREEIKRLKQQISGYKTNLSLTNERCKELQSDNESLVQYKDSLKESRDKWISLSEKLTAENKQLKQRKFWQIWK